MRRLLLMFLMLGLLSFAAGCGDDDDEDGGGSDEPAQEETSTAAEEPQKLSIEITAAGEGEFELTAPESIEAGLVEIELKNSDEDAPHEAQLIRIEEGGDVEEFFEAIQSEEGAPIPDFAQDPGGVGTTAPGETRSVTQVLEPGSYVIFDSEEPEGEDVEANYENGAQATLEVTGEAVEGELPETEGRIVADEYSFETEGLVEGENTVTFENAGEELHHVIAFPFTNDETTIEELAELFQSEEEPEGPPPVDFERGTGTAVIDGGASQVATLNFESGRYALVCFITDREGGPPHVAEGMVAEVEIP